MPVLRPHIHLSSCTCSPGSAVVPSTQGWLVMIIVDGGLKFSLVSTFRPSAMIPRFSCVYFSSYPSPVCPPFDQILRILRCPPQFDDTPHALKTTKYQYWLDSPRLVAMRVLFPLCSRQSRGIVVETIPMLLILYLFSAAST